jgi:hypothetical protein
MGKRVTIVLDLDLIKKLRLIQAKEIQQTNQSTSFSKIINDQLRKKAK